MRERLTKRVGDKVYINTDTIPRNYCDGDFGFQWCRYAKSCPSVRERTCPVLRVLDKLAEYEDKDEKGGGNNDD
jgi:hypothetical protein